MYTIVYTDHRRDEQKVKCSSFEDAERVAQFLANLYGTASLNDGWYMRSYGRVENAKV